MMRPPFLAGAALACALAVPRLAAQDLQEIVNISFVADARLFTVMAAINAGGFDHETAAEMHPVRAEVRRRLESLDPVMLRRLRDFYVAHHLSDTPQREIARYTSLALLLSEPPALSLTVVGGNVPLDAQSVMGFEQILPGFYAEAGLEQIWLQVRPRYMEEVEKYKPVIQQSARQVLEYLRTEPRVALDRQIVFMPDLMSAHGLANSRIVNNLYYLIVGPAAAAEKNLSSVRHEYLHFLLDPLMDKNALPIVDHADIRRLLMERPHLLDRFGGDPKMLHVESLIEAIQLRLDRAADAAEGLAESYRAGNVLVYHYFEQLEAFERGITSFFEYFPVTLQAFDLRKERQRAAWVAAAAGEERRLRDRREQEERRQEERLRALAEVDALLQSRSFAQAEERLRALRELDPADPPVLFGLGQIEFQRRSAEAAQEYFSQVAAGSRSPAWMAARSRIYLASLHLAAGRTAEARRLLQQVAEEPGDLKGAQEDARRRLAGMPPS